MKTKMLLSMVVTLNLIFVVASRSFAQSDPRYIPLPGGVKGALYKPDSGPAPHVGVLVMHRTSNVLSSLPCTELSRRGFMVLCSNPRFDNNEALVEWELIAFDVRAGVNFLRNQPGITKVILLGGSGGGPTMTFYQAVAQNGPSYCQGPNKLVQCGNNLAGLPPADGIVLRDAHPGNPVNALRALNPAVVNELRPDRLNPRLNLFNPDNGYNPNGPSTYSEQFKKRYSRAQAERMNKLIDKALEIVRRIAEGTHRFPDNDAFVIGRAGASQAGGGAGANLFELDLSIFHSTVNPQKLVKNDGTIVTQIVESVRVPDLTLAEESATFDEGAKLLTVSSFLSANAIRATDSLDYSQIDWCSSNNSTPCALQNISVPILIGAMGGHYFIRDNEFHYEVSASPDKDFIVIEGATHGITPCVPCEQFPGQYSNTVRNFFDYIAAWINARF
jgi:hypothetical protein